MTADPPEWMPVEGVELQCGRWRGGVRLPMCVAVRVVSRLRNRSGPVVQDQAADTGTWLVAPGAVDGWEQRVPGVDIMRGPRVLAVPPASWCEGPWTGGPDIRWLIRPTATCLTDPPVLLDALRHVLPGGTR